MTPENQVRFIGNKFDLLVTPAALYASRRLRTGFREKVGWKYFGDGGDPHRCGIVLGQTLRFSETRLRELQLVIPRKKGGPVVVDTDEHPRPDTTLEMLSRLKGVNDPELSVTAGNASGVNDGACALLIASEAACRRHGLVPHARILGMATAGVEPRVMGIGPVPAANELLKRLDLSLRQMDVIELNEAVAAQGLAVLRHLDLADDAAHVNPNDGAIALGHPLGMSGARLVGTAMHELTRSGGRYALCTMCVGVGQGISMVIERV